MFDLPDLNVTGFESKAYIRYYAGGLSAALCVSSRLGCKMPAVNVVIVI